MLQNTQAKASVSSLPPSTNRAISGIGSACGWAFGSELYVKIGSCLGTWTSAHIWRRTLPCRIWRSWMGWIGTSPRAYWVVDSGGISRSL
jgi:hypothetical protein